MTRVAARKPMLAASACMMGLGLLNPVGVLFATMPVAVGYGVLILIFALVFSQGIRELQKQPLGNKESFVVGISMLIGMGAMFLPSAAFCNFPGIVQYIFSNGLVDGVIMAIIMDNLLLKNPPDKAQAEK